MDGQQVKCRDLVVGMDDIKGGPGAGQGPAGEEGKEELIDKTGLGQWLWNAVEGDHLADRSIPVLAEDMHLMLSGQPAGHFAGVAFGAAGGDEIADEYRYLESFVINQVV